MRNEVMKTKVLKVMKEFSDHPFFTELENWKFRAVHDWYSHIIAKQGFDQKGEIKAYNTHTKMFPKASLPALFTEVVGQACYATTRNGTFPEQKVAILKGFDYENLGRVEGWLIDKAKKLTPVVEGSGTQMDYWKNSLEYWNKLNSRLFSSDSLIVAISDILKGKPQKHDISLGVLHVLEQEPMQPLEKVVWLVSKAVGGFNYAPETNKEDFDLSLADIQAKLLTVHDEALDWTEGRPPGGHKVLYRSDYDYDLQTNPRDTWSISSIQTTMDIEDTGELDVPIFQLAVYGAAAESRFKYVFIFNTEKTTLLKVVEYAPKRRDDIPLTEVRLPLVVGEKLNDVVRSHTQLSDFTVTV
jgi:hypothetical protein